MKVTAEHFEQLQRGLIATLKAHNLHPFMVNSERHAWDCFHKAWQEGRIDGNALYRHYNDANIATAMKKIFKR
jgi:hypothetical protein